MSISYPVDPDSRWSMWSISAGEVIKSGKRWPRHDGQPLEDPDPDIIPLLQVATAKPAYNPITHYVELTDPIIDLAGNTITQAWVILPLDADALDYEQRYAQVSASIPDMLAGTGNSSERVTRLEKACAFMWLDGFER